jgi:hypothetical protein
MDREFKKLQREISPVDYSAYSLRDVKKSLAEAGFKKKKIDYVLKEIYPDKMPVPFKIDRNQLENIVNGVGKLEEECLQQKTEDKELKSLAASVILGGLSTLCLTAGSFISYFQPENQIMDSPAYWAVFGGLLGASIFLGYSLKKEKREAKITQFSEL